MKGFARATSHFARQRTRHGIAAVVFGVLSLAVLAAPAAAAPTWLAPTDLSTPQARASEVRIGSDRAGNTVAVWREGVGGVIQAASRPAGGSWSASQTVSFPGQSARSPDLAVAENGMAVVVWRAFEAGHWVVQASMRAPAGAWTSPVTLSSPADDADGLVVAMGGPGNAPVAAVGWISDRFDTQAQAATWSAQGGWGAAADLSAPSDGIGYVAIAVAGDGEVTAVWTGGRGTAAVVEDLTRLPGGTGWKGPVELASSSTHPYFEPVVAADRSGQVTVAWSSYEDIYSAVVQARTRPAGTGGWEPTVNLSLSDTLTGGDAPPTGYAHEPRLEAGRPGEVTAAWSFDDTQPSRVYGRTRPTGSTQWGSIEDISGIGYFELSFQPDLAGGPSGRPVAVWTTCDLMFCSVKAAARMGSDAWDTPVTLSGARAWATYPQIAGDADGDAVAAWLVAEDETEPALAQAAGYDAAGPQLRDLDIPATGKVGSPLTFSVAPLDVWSTVDSVEWDFGDGRTATGESVSHAYRRPGTFEVRVTATDALGNSTTAADDVRVHWPAVPKRPLREAHAIPRP